MWKVTVNSIRPSRSGGGEFETQELAQAWINSQMLKPGRRPEREIIAASESFDENEVISEREEEGIRYVTLCAEAEFIIEDITAQKAQEQTNAEAQEFLDSSDWKILRHLRQQALGISTSLSEQEFLDLEQERQEAAESIIR